MNEKAAVFQSILLSDAGIRNGFFTRRASDLKPGVNADAGADEDSRNKGRVELYLESLGAKTLALPVQVHGSGIWIVENGSERSLIRGPLSDVAISRGRDIAVGVLTADCVPILLSAEDGSAVAAVHGGWRGLYAGVIGAALRELCRVADTDVRGITAAIGPAIGQCCYEVGQDLADRFVEKYPWIEKFVRKAGSRTHLYLAGIANRLLIDEGLAEEKIETLDCCTCCKAELFHSYRRDKDDAGRQLSAIAPGMER